MATVRLRCDGPDCGITRQAQPGVSLAALRKALAKVGWVHTQGLNRDLCPRCVATAVRQ